MNKVYCNIVQDLEVNKKLLAVLLDPDKLNLDTLPDIIEKINVSFATHIFLGGSKVAPGKTQMFAKVIKEYTTLPLILFPGDEEQITAHADALLFLSLLSGRNPEYLIGQHVKAAEKLKNLNLEVIPTAYLLIEGGKETAIQKVSKTKPIPVYDTAMILNTALAGQFLGAKFVYLEAGSGALYAIPPEIIGMVSNGLNIPLIVGGGIRNFNQIEMAFNAGANMVVIGTAFEKDIDFFEALKKEKQH